MTSGRLLTEVQLSEQCMTLRVMDLVCQGLMICASLISLISSVLLVC